MKLTKGDRTIEQNDETVINTLITKLGWSK